MKKSLIALAVLAASGAAMAQSSVTLFGVVDAGVGYINNANAAGDSLIGLNTSGNLTSRLGFRGVEDLGGGLKAGFWLEGEILNDTGAGLAAGGLSFNRRSTISLAGGFGEVRMGRELTPGYGKTALYDLFGQVGVGQFMAWTGNWYAPVSDAANAVRSSNMINYYTPNFSGFTAGVGYGFDEQTTGKGGRYVGGYVAYDKGPLSVAASYDKRNVGAVTGTAPVAAFDRSSLTLAGSYNLNVAKLVAILHRTEDDRPGLSDRKLNAYALGVSAPVGAGEVKLQYSLYDQKAINSKAHHIALGYVHNLSKRTAVYGTVAYMDNKNNSNVGLTARNLSIGGPGAGENQTGVQVGIRHSF